MLLSVGACLVFVASTERKIGHTLSVTKRDARGTDHVVRFTRPSLLAQFLHTASDQKPEPGKAWERGYKEPRCDTCLLCEILFSFSQSKTDGYSILMVVILYKWLMFFLHWAILLERYSSVTFTHDLESQKYVAMDRLAMLEAKYALTMQC